VDAITKLRVKLPKFSTKYHAMMTNGRLEVQLQAFVTSTVDGSELSASTAGTHWVKDWMGARFGGEEKKHFPPPLPRSEPPRPDRSLVTILIRVTPARIHSFITQTETHTYIVTHSATVHYFPYA